ncbi:MAG: SOS response-associated peptidase [Alphaproteobacteria bacterium]|nr:SOS response-associated peptidase [Alphaproteobacteria bacterium]
MMAWDRLVDLDELIRSTSSTPETVTPMRFATVICLKRFQEKCEAVFRPEPRQKNTHDGDGKRKTVRMRWGFVPAHAHDPMVGTKFIHARAETLHEKPTFRDAFFNRRGLVVVHTFNEGKEITPRKTEQHVITPRDGKPLAIAVIWEHWAGAPAPGLDSFAMVTVPANRLIGTITDRMPAVVLPEHWATWLGETPARVDEIKAILRPIEGDWEMQPEKPKREPPPPRQASLF